MLDVQLILVGYNRMVHIGLVRKLNKSSVTLNAGCVLILKPIYPRGLELGLDIISVMILCLREQEVVMNKYLLIFNISILLISIISGMVSGDIKNNFNIRQEGERLFIFIHINYADKIISKKIGFRYTSFEILFKGDEYHDLHNTLLSRGYLSMESKIYCKKGNSVMLRKYHGSLLLEYEHDSKNCK